MNLIRGRDVNARAGDPAIRAEERGPRHREGAALGDCQRVAEGWLRRRRRAAVRQRVLRESGPLAEADPSGADGPRVPRPQANRAFDGAGRRTVAHIEPAATPEQPGTSEPAQSTRADAPEASARREAEAEGGGEGTKENRAEEKRRSEEEGGREERPRKKKAAKA